MLNKVLEKLGWEAHPFKNKKASYWKKGIARTRTRRQDLPPKIIVHFTQGGTGWGKSGLIRFATLEATSVVCLWFASKITTSCRYKKIAPFDYVRIPGSEGSKPGYAAKIITVPISAPSWSVKSIARTALGRRRKSKITGKYLETNHSGRLVVAVEIVGFSRDAVNFTDAEYEELGEMIADISEAITEEDGHEFVPKTLKNATRLPDPASRGKKAACRLPYDVWEMGDFNLIDHSSIPDNSHGDVGILDLDRIAEIARRILAERKGQKPAAATQPAAKPRAAKAAAKPAKKSAAVSVGDLLGETATLTGKVSANLVKIKKELNA